MATLGLLMIATPFVLMFIFAAKSLGIWEAVAIFAVSIGLLLFLKVGFALICADGEPSGGIVRCEETP